MLGLELNIDKKAISTTGSFDRNYKSFENLRERVSTFAFSCAEKLRKKLCSNSIGIFIHSNRHRKDLKQCKRNIVIQLPYSSNSSIDLVKITVKGLEKIYQEGYSYKRAGVIVSNLVPENQGQNTLFENKILDIRN